MSELCVYIWKDPKTQVPIYVGKGAVTRPLSHLRARSRLGNTLRKRQREGFACVPYKIVTAESNADACEMEQLLIAMYGREDLGTGTLFNLTDGGEGTPGRKWTAEQVAKQKETARIVMNSPEVKTKISAGGRKAKASKEMREQMRATTKESHSRQDVKKKIGDASRAMWAQPGFREAHIAKIKVAHSKPEVKKKVSESLKKTLSTPEQFARASAAQKKSWIERKARLTS